MWAYIVRQRDLHGERERERGRGERERETTYTWIYIHMHIWHMPTMHTDMLSRFISMILPSTNGHGIMVWRLMPCHAGWGITAQPLKMWQATQWTCEPPWVARCTCWDFALHLEGDSASNIYIYRGFLYITRKYGYMIIYHEISIIST